MDLKQKVCRISSMEKTAIKREVLGLKTKQACILVTGIPASGKSTMAEFLADQMNIPMLSKDSMKEVLFDEIGFRSREEKVKLGIASMNLMYYAAEQMMKCGAIFLLENNFENRSREELLRLLTKYSYTAVTVVMTGDYETIYRRFLKRNESPSRHRGHVVNDCYPEKEGSGKGSRQQAISFESFVRGIRERGMDTFSANGPRITVDTSDFSGVNKKYVLEEVRASINAIQSGRMEEMERDGSDSIQTGER